MSEAEGVLLGRAELERAFTALGERLARRGVVADVFVVVGAAMALAYDAARVTRDVDATRVRPPRVARDGRVNRWIEPDEPPRHTVSHAEPRPTTPPANPT